jgi:hypothetical protein
MTKRRFPDSLAICKYLKVNEITAAAWGRWPSPPGILFARVLTPLLAQKLLSRNRGNCIINGIDKKVNV